MLSRASAEKKGYKVLTGPRGGAYVLSPVGVKIYLQKGSPESTELKPRVRRRTYRAPGGAYGRFLKHNMALAS